MRTITKRTLFLGGAIILTVGTFGCDDCPTLPEERCGTMTLTGGVADEFAPGNSEIAYLHPDFQALLATRANPTETNFDGKVSDRHFGYSFLLPACSSERVVKRARLTMRLKALSSLGGTDQTHWYIRNDQGELEHIWGASIPGNLNNGSWQAGETRTFVFDLENMPESSSPNSVRNILPYLGKGELHVHVQDDTSVDFIQLEIESCCEESNDPNY